MTTPNTPANAVPFRVGKWLPSDQAILENWLVDLIEDVEKQERPLLPVIQEFKELIEDDP